MTNLLKQFLDWTVGKKTYTVAVLIVIVTYLKVKGLIGGDEITLVYGLLGALGLTTLRMAVDNK